jgi:tetratricopeptide (TPR) repeat protein
MKKFIYILLVFSCIGYSQKDIKDAIQICTAFSNFESLDEANSTLEQILDAAGLSKNFSLFPCDGVPNAAAFTFNGDRYIFYNKDFMYNVSNKTNDLSNLFILAHEVGHHVNFHTKDLLLLSSGEIAIPKLEEKRKQELEADEFAGFVMARLGYSLLETKEALKNIKNDWRTEKYNDDQYSTHPTILKRLGAVNTGYFRVNPPNLSAMEYWQRGNQKANSSDFIGAERDYLASIEILDIGIARLGLAKSQYYLEKFNEALVNINIAISEAEDDPELYFWRGIILWGLQNKTLACDNWSYAVRLGGDEWGKNLELCD